jgi:N-methylhydantoinase B/oxoprolinase/acetone carboxylase alpha subunit
MPPMPNSSAARDIAYYLHPQTSLRRHRESGPLIIDRGEGAVIYDDSGKRYIETVAGLWCASLGFSASERILNSTATLSHLGDRHVFQPYGIFGGRPGALAESILNPQGNGERLHSKETRQIKRGDILSFRLSGAGGYGSPAERDPAAISRHVAEGYITKEAAMRDYGWSASSGFETPKRP